MDSCRNCRNREDCWAGAEPVRAEDCDSWERGIPADLPVVLVDTGADRRGQLLDPLIF